LGHCSPHDAEKRRDRELANALRVREEGALARIQAELASSTGTPLERGAISADDPSEALLEQWRIAELLTHLPTEEATMLRMRFYDGSSQREIAAQLEVPLGTVKMRMVHALERLHQMLDEEGSLP
jgi:RNA polymerase sigma-70 factor, ECF subfamily